MSLRAFTTLFVLCSLAACAHNTIAGTTIKDTTDNRAVYEVVKKALDAIVQRDADTLLSLVSHQYFEDNATPQPEDDYGYEQLKELLPESLKAAKEIFIDVKIHDIVVEKDQARADVRYNSRMRLDLPAGSKWDSHKEFNRLYLAREDGQWKIVSGL